MPIYEYKCARCGKVSEILVGVGAESASLKCEHCGGSRLEKLMSVSACIAGHGHEHTGGCCDMGHACDEQTCQSEGHCCEE